MATFAFSGRTRGGESVAGERMGDSMEAVSAALRREQIQVTRIAPVAAKAAAAKKLRVQVGPGQEPGGLHPPVLGDDRRRPAAGPVPGHPRQPGRAQVLPAGHPADPHRRRRRPGAGRRDEAAIPSVRRALHEHDRRRRGGRHPRHDPEAAGGLHREGRQAEGAGPVGDDLPDRGHRDRGRRRRRDSVEGHPDLRQPVRRPRRRTAAADAHRHRAQQQPGALHAVPDRRCSSVAATRCGGTTPPRRAAAWSTGCC